MINLCVYGVPPGHIYKGWREEEAGSHRVCPKCGVLLGLRSPSRIPPPTWNRKNGREGKEERGAPPPLPCPIRTKGGGGAWPALAGPSLLPYGPSRPNNPWGVPVTPRYSSKIPISPGRIPISKYRLLIYRYLCLDHFETPRHVHDHIRDSELLRCIKTHKLII